MPSKPSQPQSQELRRRRGDQRLWHRSRQAAVALDGSFLRLESPQSHMHVGFSAVFAAPSGRPRPTVEALRERAAGRLHEVPWCRWRLDPAPLGLSEPRWIDDDRFDLAPTSWRSRSRRTGQPRELRGAALDGPVRSAGPVAAAVADLPGAAARGRPGGDGGQDPPRARRRARRAADRQPDPRSRARRGVGAAGRLAAAGPPGTRRLGAGRGHADVRRRRRRAARRGDRGHASAGDRRECRARCQARPGRGRRGSAVTGAAECAQRADRRAAHARRLPRRARRAAAARRGGGTLNDVGLAAVAGAVRALLQRDGERRRPSR